LTLIYLIVLVLLLLLNAFFVLAEFAAVRVRDTQISELEDRRAPGAGVMRHVHEHLDEYLSVCQLGITFASIGLGFVGEPSVARLLMPVLGHAASAHAVAITISYLLVSLLHMILSEQLPKCIAIRFAERSAHLTAPPLLWSRKVLYLPLVVVNGSVNLILKMFGLDTMSRESAPSEAEIRIILEKSQQQGMMPFRRLLLVENVFDFGTVRVKDEMRGVDQVVALRADRPWEENRDKILSTSFSRYPLLEGDPTRVIGIVHLKDLLYRGTPWPDAVDLRSIARKAYLTAPDVLLEQLLTDLRRRRNHMAIAQTSDGRLAGLITMEDILEQLVGAIEDEFEHEVPLRLGDVLKESRIVLDLQAVRSEAAIAEIIRRCDTSDIPGSKQSIIDAVIARERNLPTYLGENIAVPHARLDSIKMPILFFARSTGGVVFDPALPQEKALMLFLLLAPGSVPRMQTRMLAKIAALRESSYVWDRLLRAAAPAEAFESIRSGDELITH
jgi:CBS domain containing-hemolysin-like protein